MSRNDDINSLSHSKWRCHYHVVFAPKYRRQAIYGKIKAKAKGKGYIYAYAHNGVSRSIKVTVK